ncbi:MAG: hypothetical protein HY056_01320 [Proteobacteria bacterium]|nr:hypothetical protein [Pseudomonadota bacterium]
MSWSTGAATCCSVTTSGNDAQPPAPAFSAAQYDRLAPLYTIASVRASVWIIPAFHAPIDSGIRGGHDDPMGFDLAAFARSLERLLDALKTQAAAQALRAP